MSALNVSGVVIEPLTKRHNRKLFDCGQPDLNAFVRQFAMQQQRQGYNQGYAAMSDGKLVGFYCLSAASLAFTDLPESQRRGLPRYPVPCVCIGRFAVAVEWQGQGLGRKLLAHALRRVLEASGIVGVSLVLVDAKNEVAAAFYASLGFMPLDDKPLTLFLPVSKIAEGVGNG